MKTQEEAVQKVSDALAANADKVDGILATGYTPTVAIAQVLSEYKSKGGNRTIHAVGIDTDPTVIQAIKDGVMDGTIVQNNFGHGYLSLLLLLAMQNGYTPKQGVYFVNSGFAFATKDNLDTYNNDILKVSEQIKNEMLSKYLEGGSAAAAAPAAAMSPELLALSTKDLKVVWYAPAPHPYFEDVRKGIEAFEKDFGVTVEKQIGPDWKQDSQNQNMEALAAKGFTSFTVYPADAAGANGLYEELTRRGLVVNFGSSTAEPTTASFAVATDVKAAAMAATEKIIAAMGDKGNIINVLEVLEDPNTVLRKQGVDEVVAKHPNVKIIQEVSGMKTQEEAVQKVSDALAANADKVDGILATGYTPTVAIAQVLSEYKSKGGNRTIHAVGIDTDPTVIQAIKDGVMDGTIVQNNFGHGYLSLLLLLAMQNSYAQTGRVLRQFRFCLRYQGQPGYLQ